MGAQRSVNVINCLVFPHVAMVPLLLASQKELTGTIPSCSASVQVITSNRGQRDRAGGGQGWGTSPSSAPLPTGSCSTANSCCCCSGQPLRRALEYQFPPPLPSSTKSPSCIREQVAGNGWGWAAMSPSMCPWACKAQAAQPTAGCGRGRAAEKAAHVDGGSAAARWGTGS